MTDPYNQGANQNQPPNNESPYNQGPYNQSPYGQSPYNQSPYGQSPYGQGAGYQQQGYEAFPGSQYQYAPGMPGGMVPEHHESLHDPLYNVGFGEAVTRCFQRFLQFKGRSSRAEFWWAWLASVFVSFLVAFVINLAGLDSDASISAADMIEGLVSLAIFIFTLALTWRRLHDAGFAGPWWFLSLIPVVGSFVVLILCALPTNPEKMKPEWEDPQAMYPVMGAPGAYPGAF